VSEERNQLIKSSYLSVVYSTPFAVAVLDVVVVVDVIVVVVVVVVEEFPPELREGDGDDRG